MSSETTARDSKPVDIHGHRQSAFNIEQIVLGRWSPRAMSGEPITDDELMTLFEAARWAPSSGNSQPWRFIYAKRDTRHWNVLFELLRPKNQSWCASGAVLVVVASLMRDNEIGRELLTHSYDTGAAWENIAIQGAAMGLIVHGMQGFDYQRARSVLGIPEDVAVEAMFVVGRPGSHENLAEDLQKKERPSGRKPLAEIAFEGTFPPCRDRS